jgi:TonB family protein
MTSSAPIAIHPPATTPKASAPNVVPTSVPPPSAVTSNVAPPSVAPPASQVSAHSNSQGHATTPDALRRESEKLQEQLATMLLGDAKTVSATPIAPASKVVDFPRQQNQTVKSAVPVKNAPFTSADQDEMKIPSWLEPLARNAASHPQNELTAREDSRDDRVIEFEVQDLSVPATAKEEAHAEADPIFETHLLDGQTDLASHAPKKSNKGLLIGVAAAALVLVAVGATWYSRNSSGASSQTSSTTAEAAPAPAVAPDASAANSNANAGANSTQPAVARTTDKPAPNRSNINSEPVPQVQNPAAVQQNAQNAQNGAPTAQLAKGVDKNVSAELNAYKKLAEPIAVPTKKPSLGEVHLGAPKTTRATGAVVGEAEELALNSGQIAPGGDAFGGGLVGGNTKQPVAPSVPLPVGGDVKQARLISSVPPVYPQLAKSQHISGAVLIDALIDENGRVSSMKVVSGPVLLHQSAMESLRQWKYQAATLDGKAVPMHLTVTVQFRLQ